MGSPLLSEETNEVKAKQGATRQLCFFLLFTKLRQNLEIQCYVVCILYCEDLTKSSSFAYYLSLFSCEWNTLSPLISQYKVTTRRRLNSESFALDSGSLTCQLCDFRQVTQALTFSSLPCKIEIILSTSQGCHEK